MRHAAATRRPTNISLDGELLTAAKEFGVNVSRACEQGLSEQVAKARAAKWLEENREALQSWNDYVDEHGLPLERHRQF